jgi:hypothetical protein
MNNDNHATVSLSSESRDPQTPAEWQEAIDLAAGWRMIAACEMYGLLQGGGPAVDVGRCEELLRRGRERGISPSKPREELAIAVLVTHNFEIERRENGGAR